MWRGVLAVILFWLAVVSGSFWWNIQDEKQESEHLAFETARVFFRQIVMARSWNARHGGVYVPVVDYTEPNPYLDDPLRDLSTDKGIKLTKINPAYMTRQIAEIAAESGDSVRMHITSLNPIRPENAPEEWEKEYLRRFEQGEEECGEFCYEASTSYFRYMAPLYVEEACMKCHAQQGYKAGDIRGGISVTLPHFPEASNGNLLAGYGVAASLGVFIIVTGGFLLNRERSLLSLANQTLQEENEQRQRMIGQLQEANDQIKKLSGVVPICMHCKKIRDDQGYWNQLERFISEHSEAKFSHGICEDCKSKLYPGIGNY